MFVDVGANVGTFSLVMARHVGPQGKVIGIEPHPVTFARLAFNNAATKLAQVRLVQAAAGPEDGELLIETDGGNLGASHVVTGNGVLRSDQGAVAAPDAHSRRGRRDQGRRAEDRRRGFEDCVLMPFFRDAPPSRYGPVRW